MSRFSEGVELTFHIPGILVLKHPRIHGSWRPFISSGFGLVCIGMVSFIIFIRHKGKSNGQGSFRSFLGTGVGRLRTENSFYWELDLYFGLKLLVYGYVSCGREPSIDFAESCMPGDYTSLFCFRSDIFYLLMWARLGQR